MCNFYGHKVTKIELIKLKQIEKELGTLAALKTLEEMKSGFAYGDAPVLRKTSANDFEVINMHWEFIPTSVTTMKQLEESRQNGIPWLNARGETLLSSKMFHEAAFERRCLVLASHFFEWRHYKPEGAKKEKAYPYVIEVADADYFYMAGIYNTYTNPVTGIVLNSFAIVTTKAINSWSRFITLKRGCLPLVANRLFERLEHYIKRDFKELFPDENLLF